MKIGIVGLRPHQISDIQNRNFELDLEFIEASDSKRIRPENVTTLASKVDRVILVRSSVPATAPGAVPKEKLVLLPRGVSVSSVVRVLGEFQSRVAKEKRRVAPLISKTVLTAFKPEGSRSDEPTPYQQLEAALMREIPDGYESGYKPPTDNVVVQYPGLSGRQDYKILRAAQKGDVIRFARPKHITADEWRGRINSARDYYYRMYQMVLEAHFFKTYVDLFVLDLPDRTGVRATVHEDIGPTSPREDNTSPSPLQAAVVEDIPAPTTLVPTESEPEEKPGMVEETPFDRVLALGHTGGDREFWKQVLLSCVADEGVENAADRADRALLAYHARFSR